MDINQKRRALSRVAELLPTATRSELLAIIAANKDAYTVLRELRIRGGGLCTVVMGRRELPLSRTVSTDQVGKMLKSMTEESLYAYRDSLAGGYLPMPDGVRVGICGTARYDGGRRVGVGEVRSMVFRFPFGSCEFAEKMWREHLSLGGGGLLVISAPGGGKTTALRALARVAAAGQGAMRVAVVDEREEFIASDYCGCAVDLLRGYCRTDGTELALRNLSAEIIVADEITTAEDAEAAIACFGTGVGLIASAHGTDEREVRRRPRLARLFELGVFGSVAEIFSVGEEFDYRLIRMKNEVSVGA